MVDTYYARTATDFNEMFRTIIDHMAYELGYKLIVSLSRAAGHVAMELMREKDKVYMRDIMTLRCKIDRVRSMECPNCGARITYKF